MSSRRILITIAALTTLMVSLAVFSVQPDVRADDAEPSSSDEDTVTVTGYLVYELTDGESTQSLPLTGVLVTISWESGYNIGMTNTNGIYEISGVPRNASLGISFAYPGMTVSKWYSSIMSANQDSDAFSLTLPRVLLGKCDLSSYPVTMKNTSLEIRLMNESSTGNIPLADTSVTITDAFGQSSTGTTDTNGWVTLRIGSVYGLSLTAEYPDGYSFIPGIFFMDVTNVGGTQQVVFDLEGTYDDLGATYSIPVTDYTNGRIYTIGDPILMSASTATVSITVRDSDGTPLEGATVILQHTEKQEIRYTAITDRNGMASFDAVTTTAYTLTVEVNGFDTYYGGTVEVVKGAIPLPDAVMTPKTVSTWFGINLGHIMMIMGIIIGIILAIISILLFTRHLHGNLEEEEPE